MATGEEKSKWGDGSPVFPTHEESSFDISITYPNKKSSSEILSHVFPQIKSVWHGSQNRRNKLFYGDNLDVLAYLMQASDTAGKIQLVYIDPPFATNKVFKSRARKDAYQDLMDGANYLEFIRERLVFLREMLSEDGSIYVHLDSNMAFHVKILMDEIFGRSNFRNFITRRKCNPKNYTRNRYGNISDYILFYTKSNNFVWNRPHRAWTPDKAADEYQYVEQETGRRYKKVPIHAPGERNGATGQPWRGMSPPPGKHWQYSPKTLDEMDARGEIYWSPTGNPRRKIYLDESKGIPVQDIWLDVKDAHNQNIKITGYPTEKPAALLQRIIEASSNPGDLVLDCFSGSGTTLNAASDLGREWIGIDRSLEAIETTLQRFLKGLSPMGDFVADRKPSPKQNILPLFEPTEIIRDFQILAPASLVSDLDGVIAGWVLALERREH